ncbi:hypothetical protein B0H10DRAFT_1944738 [Mycena sp. CBHHK59/15]|nr:hypothetical protein B0H10DRAFT_1944738 [Mycena sp. CBHHK59/15]
MDPRDRVRWVVSVVAALVQYLVLGVAVYIAPQYNKTDLHTSALSGRAWLNELVLVTLLLVLLLVPYLRFWCLHRKYKSKHNFDWFCHLGLLSEDPFAGRRFICDSGGHGSKSRNTDSELILDHIDSGLKINSGIDIRIDIRISRELAALTSPIKVT